MTAAEGWVASETKVWAAMMRSSNLTVRTSVTERTRTKRDVKA